MRAEETIRALAQKADIRFNGKQDWDIQVNDRRFYNRVLSQGSLGLGESYMDGWWDAGHIDQVIDHVLRAELDKAIKPNLRILVGFVRANLTNMQNRSRSFVVGQQHYDLGNELYEAMLDPYMVYSCGYWPEAKTLDEAQIAKLDLICRKLELKPGMKLLDIGCGWGGLLKYAAEKYGVSGVGVTVSVEQAKLAKQRLKGLPIEIKTQDYRSIMGQFDRVASVGMFEHVGYKNYASFMQTAERVLTDQGLLLLHSIASNVSVHKGDPWLEKYIFPNGMLPSISQIGKASEGLLVMEDWHNFGPYYDKTVLAWYANFKQAWPELKDHYDERFYRMWSYYLQSCAAIFRSRDTQLWQIVFSKGRRPIYQSVR